MSEFIVSARKYRPQDWNDVVGQSSITDTLQNAIESGKLAHAFLFCGPRGVGKTTCARIFAKKINQKELNDPNEDFAFNVFELDAASNNSTDDIKHLIEQVRIPPQKGSYKVYVVDEVHMLSAQAFNAFLKTLEEPPPYAIFILATTEKHKILPTILSRCQIYDFSRITIEDMTSHLAGIAEQEGYEYENDGLAIIAKKADGALRDALSIFDQIASFSRGKLTYQNVVDNLGVLDLDLYFNLVDAINEENIQKSVLLYHDVINGGYDNHHFLLGLTEHYRNLIMAASPDTVHLIEAGDNVRSQYQEQFKTLDTAYILNALEVLGTADGEFRQSKNKRLLIELSLMQLCSLKAHQKKKSKRVAIIPPNGVKIEPQIQVDQVVPKEITLPDKVDVKAKEIRAFQPQPNDGKKVVKRKKAFSINQKLAEPSKKETVQQDSGGMSLERDNQPVNQDGLEAMWNKYANYIRKQGKVSFHTTLTTKKPRLDGNVIHFTINNAVQEEDFNLHRAEILEFLRTNLKNFDLQLQWKLEEMEVEANLYTPTQKFNRLVEKNPDIQLLRQTFDLDIDF